MRAAEWIGRAIALGSAALACTLTACASRLPEVPPNASVGTSLRSIVPPVRPNNGPPEIVAMAFSSLDVRRGRHWSAQFLTGTNVASVEVRSNLFSIDVPRTAFGRFAFDLDVLDVPPIFIRPYRLRVIARNAAGDVKEEDLPFQIR
jgi:hypothetical protein